MTSNCSLLLNRGRRGKMWFMLGWLLFSGLAQANAKIEPFGEIATLFKNQEIFRGSDDRLGTAVITVRFSKVESRHLSCQSWVDALRLEPAGATPIDLAGSEYLSQSPWNPWTPSELEPIEECDSFPCRVKFDKSEVEAMKKTGPIYRKDTFQKLVKKRVSQYLENGLKPEYEFAGKPIDPFAVLEFNGYPDQQKRPKEPKLYLRKLDFAPGKYRAVRQVLDRRWYETPRGGTPAASLWVRDVYGTHYFEAWGEWSYFECDGANQTLYQALVVELDNLKSSDFLSLLSRGKMRSEIKKNSETLLNEAFERILKAAKAATSSAVSPAFGK